MNAEPRRPESDPTHDLSRMTSLFSLAAQPPTKARPVDRLIERLEPLNDEDTLAWLDRALLGLDLDRTSLMNGDVGLERLRSAKSEAKRRFLGENRDHESRLEGLAGYLFLIASAVIHHGAVIGSQGRTDVDDVLLDLAATVPTDTGEFFGRAALKWPEAS